MHVKCFLNKQKSKKIIFYFILYQNFRSENKSLYEISFLS
jgi:hypothetical protein